MKLAFYMTSLRLENWVTRGAFSYFWTAVLSRHHLSSSCVALPPSQPPSEEKINGILLGFRIRYRELLYDRLRSYSAHNINSASTWAELNGERSVQLTCRIQVGS